MSRHNYHRRKKKNKNRTAEVLAAVIAVLTVACAYAGKVNPLSFFPAPFMALAFMPMLIVSLIALAIALLWRRWIAVLVIVASLVFSLPIITMFVPINNEENRPARPVDKSMTLKVMTYNVLGFNFTESDLTAQPSASMQLILDANPDVVLMQEGGAAGFDLTELPSVEPFREQILKRYPYYYNSDDGLNILSKYPFTAHSLGDRLYARSPRGYNREQTSYLARAFDLQLPSGKQLRLVDFRLQSYHLSFAKNMSMRVSPDVKPSRLERMRRSFALRGANADTLRHLLDQCPPNVIVCGDMNDITASHVYRVICGDDFHDAWCDAGNGYAYTYNRHGLKFRIDHILYRGGMRPFEAERIEDGSSDHYPLMVTFDLDIN